MLFPKRGFKYVGRWSGAVQKANRLVYSIEFALPYSPMRLRYHNKNRKAVCQNVCITLFPNRRDSSLFIDSRHDVAIGRVRPVLGEAT
jgi:hypothetical protein